MPVPIARQNVRRRHPPGPRRSDQARRSLWLDTRMPVDHPTLTGSITVDVAVIGGGITGLTTALLLSGAGMRVAVVEADQVGAAVSGNNMAKVTALQGTTYTAVAREHGLTTARSYAEANLAGVEQVAAIVATERIDCDLRRASAYTYAHTEAESLVARGEAVAASGAGLRVVWEDDSSLDVPFRVFGAVRLDDQVVLHPGRYTQGLAAAVLARSGVVFENSRVVHVRDGSPCVIRTAHGSVLADRVVVATHYPVLDDGEYLARLEPTRGCCVAIRLRSGTPPRGLAISAGRPSWSLSHSGELLVLAGSGHPGVGGESYPYLESFARAHFDVAEVTHRWSAQDSASSDHLPVIGAHTPGSRTVFVAAGFRKWGLSAGTAAAMILRDLLVDVPNPWADPLSPNRLR